MRAPRPFPLIFSLLVLFAWQAQAQPSSADSLIRELTRLPQSRDRVLTLHRLASDSWDFSFESANQYAQEAYTLAHKLADPELIAIAATDLGMYHYFTGNYKAAKSFFLEALQVSGARSYGEYPAYTLTRLGNLYRVQGKYDSARYYYDKSLIALGSTPGATARSSVYHNLGWLHYELAEYERAFAVMRKALSIRLGTGDSLLIAECWKFIGMTHRTLSDFDSADFYLERVKRIATRYNDSELTIFYRINQGEMQFAKGEMAAAISSYRIALDMLSTHKFKRYQAITLKRVGQVYEQLDDFESAHSHFSKALILEEELGSQHEIGRTYAQMGWCYTRQRQYNQGTEYADRALAIMRRVKDKAGIAFVHNLMGTIEFRTNKLDRALIYFDSALATRQAMKLDVYVASTLENKGYVYEKQERYQEASAVFRAAVAAYERLGSNRRLANAYNNVGNTLMKQGRPAEAEVQFQRAVQTARKINFLPSLRDSYRHLALLMKKQGQYRESVEYFEKFNVLNDSLFNTESAARAAQAQALYDLERKEMQIAQLASENQLKQTELQLKDDQLRSQFLALVFAVAAVALLVVMVIVVYRYYRTKKEANQKLELLNFEILEQKEEIQAQAEELMESNDLLTSVNRELSDKKEEIESQSEELRKANDAIYQNNKTLEKKVQERTQELRQAYFELDTFFYRSSHDFRRPLTTFMGLAEVAKITLKDANAIHLFDKVKETAISLDKMLMKLQSISDVGFQQLALKEVYFKELLDTVLTAYSHEIKSKAITVTTEIDQAVVLSYPSLLKIVVENLVENAINFSRPNHPTITIYTRQRDDVFVLEVEDNGQGVSPEYHGKIFEMYFRANPESKGNGLGLYISRKAVEKLNGVIRIAETESGKGSLFVVELPNPAQGES